MYADRRIVPARAPERGGVVGTIHAFVSWFSRLMEDRPWQRVRLPRLFALVLRHPRDAAMAIGVSLAVAAIIVNSVYLQHGPHPAPIFAIHPPPVVPRDATGAVHKLPRPRPGEVQRTDVARIDPVPLPRPRIVPAVATAAHADPIADLIEAKRPANQANASPANLSPANPSQANPSQANSSQVSALQRALNEFGYGPIKVSGVLDDDTRESIERFERDHNLAVTGQNTQRLRRAVATATGRTLD
jgi:putative peptidoglycan binding protein